MMRGFRKPYGKLFAGETFTTVRSRPWNPPHDDGKLLGRKDGIVLFPRTKKALSLGRTQIIAVHTIGLKTFEALCTEEFARYDAEKTKKNLIADLRKLCESKGTSTVQILTYLWIHRTQLCQSIYELSQIDSEHYKLLEDDVAVKQAREDQVRLRELGMEL